MFFTRFQTDPRSAQIVGFVPVPVRVPVPDCLFFAHDGQKWTAANGQATMDNTISGTDTQTGTGTKKN
jgi:hypothetical protein